VLVLREFSLLTFLSHFFHDSPLQQQQQCVMIQAFTFLKTARLVSMAESKTMQGPTAFGSVGVGVAGILAANFFESFFSRISFAAAAAVCDDSGVYFFKDSAAGIYGRIQNHAGSDCIRFCRCWCCGNSRR